jgi:hypothetical protein
MKLNLHFLEAEAPLAALRDRLADEATALVDQIDNIVPARLRRQVIDVVIQSVAGEGEGAVISGHCFRHSFVTVSLAVTDTQFAPAMMRGCFRHTLGRQLHFALRQAVFGRPHTLGEALTAHGLAAIFADLVAAAEVPDMSLAPADWPDVMRRAGGDRCSEAYDHAAWFEGSGSLPRGAGDALGYRLAQAFANVHPRAVATGLVEVPAEAVLAHWDEVAAAVLAVRPWGR